MDHVGGSHIPRQATPSAFLSTPSNNTSPSLIVLSFAVSLALVALAILIQSNPLILRRAISRWWPIPIDLDEWQRTNASGQQARTQSQSQPGTKKANKTKNGKRKTPAGSPPLVSESELAAGRAVVSSTGRPASKSAATGPDCNSVISPHPSSSTRKSQLQQSRPPGVHSVPPSPVTQSQPSVSKRPRTRRASLPSNDPLPSPPSDRSDPTSSNSTSNMDGLARGIPYSNILPSFLNPRAAAYEFQARYHDDPLPSLVPRQGQSTPAHHPLPHPLPAQDIQAPRISTSTLPISNLPGTQQPYDAFLVLDVEATCAPGSTFDYPNEIIEWPVVLMRWSGRDDLTGAASQLVAVDEFRSFVRPSWRPHLTEFCTGLTGISQDDIEAAPTFPEVLAQFEAWLQNHGLIPPPTALLTPPESRSASPEPSLSLAATSPTRDSPVAPLASPAQSTTSLYSPAPSFSFSERASHRSSLSSFASSGQQMPCFETDEWEQASGHACSFAWATDGPFDLRDFLVKQCFISRIAIPEYFLGDIIDVRKVVGSWVEAGGDRQVSPAHPMNLSRPAQFSVLRPASLPPTSPSQPFLRGHAKRRSLNIPLQLQALSLGNFVGRQHRGIDDARNISRILQALALKGIRLEGNTCLNPNRRWYWMGQDGSIVLPPAMS